LTLRSEGDKTAGGRFFIGVRPRPYLNSKPEESVRSVQSLLSALGLVASLMLGVTPSTAQTLAQTWPQRTVKLLLPLGPGSGVDIGARLLADRLSKRWGQPVVVENRRGGDAIVAIGAFVGATAKALGLDVPPGLSARADAVIE
jgi:hypothetical protein